VDKTPFSVYDFFAYLASGAVVVTVDPDSGGRLASVSVAGLELLVDREMHGMVPGVPQLEDYALG